MVPILLLVGKKKNLLKFYSGQISSNFHRHPVEC